MIWLIGASIIWGLSFGLIKGLTSGVDPFTLGLYRSMVATLAFAPWFRWQVSPTRQSEQNHQQTQSARHRGFQQDLIWAFICGFVQIGLMYGPYLKSFQYLKSYEVALFTMTTPLMTGLLLKPAERPNGIRLLGALFLATAGGIIGAWHDITSDHWVIGVLLVQASNILFAFGSLLWARRFSGIAHAPGRDQARLMSPYFLGASTASGCLAVIFSSPFEGLSQAQMLVIVWLGVVASGVGFFMWNRGVATVQATTLAVANNLKIPIAIIISLTVFGESANVLTLAAGLALIFLALQIANGKPKTRSHR
jgi:drug/metabolite transporter (DMT)-like permease